MSDIVMEIFTPFQLGLMSFPLLLLLIGLRIPVAAAMFGVGILGNWLIAGNFRMIDSQLKSFSYGTLNNYSLSIVPLFLLMSEFAARAGMSHALFDAARAWLGHRRGGVAMAAIGASAGFGAICGSSLATASTMGKIALPQLRRAGYSDGLATGALAAGGTLGILIPPSVILVIYAILAEENIEKLFVAAVIPAVIACFGYGVAIAAYVRLFPAAGGIVQKSVPMGARFRALFAIWPVIVIFTLVIGGIYGGVFSPTAAAAVGVMGMALVVIFKGKMSLSTLQNALLNALKVSAMIFFIIIAAGVFNAFLASAQLPQHVATYFQNADLNPWLVISAMLLFYIILGTVMDSLAMIFLTVPIFVPVVLALDFGMPPAEVGIWFGILVLMSAEIGLITPPVGLNLFVINSLSKNVPIKETYKGVLPFVLSDILRIALLVAFPAITLFLVR